MVQTYIVDLRLTREQVLRLYQGSANAVVARDRNGLTVRFPLHSLRRFVDNQGINGSFQLAVDAQHRLLGVERLSKLKTGA